MGWWRRDGSAISSSGYGCRRARRDAIAGVLDDRLQVRLAAAPVAGRANEHRIAWLARHFGVP